MRFNLDRNDICSFAEDLLKRNPVFWQGSPVLQRDEDDPLRSFAGQSGCSSVDAAAWFCFSLLRDCVQVILPT